MDFEDNLNSLYCDPNAYIQRFEKNKETKKIVFQEPYECLPSYYINNDLKKHNCDCVAKHNNHSNNNYGNPDYNCNQRNKKINQYGNLFPKEDCCNHNGNYNLNNKDNHNDNCHNNDSQKQSGFGFDLKNLLPLLSLFNMGGGADLSSLVGMLNNADKSQTGNNSNPMNLISNLMSNKEMMSGILNMFKGGGLNKFSKKQATKKELKTTDFEIKNYTRVE